MTTTLIEQVYKELRQVFDPEIPVNIVDLGLVYDVKVDGDRCDVTMTLTSQACPERARSPRRQASLQHGARHRRDRGQDRLGPAVDAAAHLRGRPQVLGIGEEGEDE